MSRNAKCSNEMKDFISNNGKTQTKSKNVINKYAELIAEGFQNNLSTEVLVVHNKIATGEELSPKT